MNVLVLGLYAEGRSDERFLPVVIRRTAERLLAIYDRPNIDAMEPIVVEIQKDRSTPGRAECILEAARRSSRYHALIVHSDADHPTAEKARHERFDPGYRLVQQVRAEEDICRELIPIIPIQMVEAWMLADLGALRVVFRAKANIQSLGLLKKVKQIESYRDPKHLIDQMVREAYPNQTHQWNKIRATLYADLASAVSLERLDQLPSYQQFVKDLTSTLKKLNLIHGISY